MKAQPPGASLFQWQVRYLAGLAAKMKPSRQLSESGIIPTFPKPFFLIYTFAAQKHVDKSLHHKSKIKTNASKYFWATRWESITPTAHGIAVPFLSSTFPQSLYTNKQPAALIQAKRREWKWACVTQHNKREAAFLLPSRSSRWHSDQSDSTPLHLAGLPNLNQAE